MGDPRPLHVVMKMTDEAGEGLFPLDQVDGKYPGCLAGAVYGVGIALTEMHPEKKAQLQAVLDRFSTGQIKDLEAIALWRDLVGIDSMLDAMKRVNSLMFYGMNLDRTIVDRPPLDTLDKNMRDAMDHIVGKVKKTEP